MNELTIYDEARKALQIAASIDEVKDIHDKAIALAAYAKQANDGALTGYANEIRARSERKGGELLLVMEKAKGGGNGSNQFATPSKIVGVAKTEKPLADIGITYKQSSAWQKVAKIDEIRARLGELLEKIPKAYRVDGSTQGTIKTLPDG